jgi:hypothetical protein
MWTMLAFSVLLASILVVAHLQPETHLQSKMGHVLWLGLLVKYKVGVR